MSSSKVNLEKFLIPLVEIKMATHNFSNEYLIGKDSSAWVYKAQLSERWQNRKALAIRFVTSDQGKQEFDKEVEMMSRFNHQNIISFIGYCDDQDDVMVTILEFAANGSLDNYLHHERRYLTWAKRLEICIGIAKGLEYLHSGLGKDMRVYHRNMKSENVLLNERHEAKISDFRLSVLVDRNNPQVYGSVVGTRNYLDPVYMESGIKQTEASTDTIRSHQPRNLELEGFLIPLGEIKLATRDFSSETKIRDERSATFYRGQLSEVWKNRTTTIKRLNLENKFRNELQVISNVHHENIVPFIGFCDEANERIIVYEYPANGSLDLHLQRPDKWCRITWAQRLKICLEAARGLEYLHSSLGEHNTLIHGDIKSANILLDDNMKAEISDFGSALVVDRNQPQVYHLPTGTSSYIDPIYGESGIVNTESDIYSFGVVLSEMLSGMLANHKRHIGDDEPQTLITLVRRYYDDGPNMLVDPFIRDEICIHSLHVFTKIMYRCISYNLKNRPTMKTVIKRIEEALHIQNNGATSTTLARTRQYQDLKSYQISLKEIIFSREPHDRIGDGGFGKVFKGDVPTRLPNCKVAIKCLDPEGHQGKKEFLTEVELISSFHHQNIIPFVGYCDDGDEMIIVSKYATNGSLDYHLRDPSRRNRLTWVRRLKICLGAAKGLDYLHSDLGKVRVIHRDIKSGNILLDEELEAKLCDFGLSKKGTINHHTQIYTKAAGTEFYLDPAYHESGILSKESDVYSFGVVLFEMLSGRLAYYPTTFVDDNPQYLIILVRRYYNHEPKKLIDPAIRDEIDSQSFDTFIKLAYQCISLKSDERPTMDTIIDGIEDAMDFQKIKCKKKKNRGLEA